jgi:DNA primase
MSSSAVEQIKSRLDIVEVVGSYIKLEKAGSNFKARCPFHNEKTASFYVSPARQSYHCFGCNRGGDIFTFVQEIEGVDFVQALENLAHRAGVQLDQFDNKLQSKTNRLYKLMTEAEQFYHQRLEENQTIKEYLLGRGLTPETIDNFNLGFAPDGWRNLYNYLKAMGYSEEEMERTGLVVKAEATGRNATRYDRFRSRIMFPLADSNGRTVGFSGRICGSEASADVAKYINTPQTVLYDKSKILFGFDKAKMEIKRADRCILVEGQMDLLMAHQCGTTNTVAVSGTALTEYHLNQINRLTTKVIMAFDGDLAGIKAARRGVDLALRAGMEVNIAELPRDMDPADLIKDKPEAWKQAIAEAKHIIDFLLSVLTKTIHDQRELKLAVSSDVLPYVASLSNSLEQAHFVSKIAATIAVSEEIIWEEVRKLKTDSSENEKVAVSTIAGQQPIVLSRREKIEKQIFSLILWQVSLGALPTELEQAVTTLKEFITADKYQEKLAYWQKQTENLILEAEIFFDNKNLSKELTELTNNYKIEILKNNLGEISGNIKQAEAKGDYEAVDKLVKQMREITKQINSIKK